jgi:hypothetical protein
MDWRNIQNILNQLEYAISVIYIKKTSTINSISKIRISQTSMISDKLTIPNNATPIPAASPNNPHTKKNLLKIVEVSITCSEEI